MVERIVLRKVKNSEELILDMMSTPNYILKSVDWGSITGTHYSYKYVNQVGETIGNTSLGTRPIVIEGWIVAQNVNQMTSLKKKLNSFVNPQEAIDLFYSNYTIRFFPDSTVKYAINESENNDVFCKFEIVGTCPNPLFSDINETYFGFTVTEPVFHFPLILSNELEEGGLVFGVRDKALIKNVVNSGAVSVGMRIIFRANGSVLNPCLINVDTQEKVLINKTLVNGEEVEINTNIGEKGVKGKIGNEDFSNYFMYRDTDSSWLRLDVGNNILSYSADSGIDKLDVIIYFYNRYLEVQECH